MLLNIKNKLLISLITISIIVTTISAVSYADEIIPPAKDNTGNGIIYGGIISGSTGDNGDNGSSSNGSSGNSNYVVPPPNTCQWSQSSNCTIDVNNLPSNCGLYSEGSSNGVICATDPDEVKRMTVGGREFQNPQQGNQAPDAPLSRGEIDKYILDKFQPGQPAISVMPNNIGDSKQLVNLPLWLWVTDPSHDKNYKHFHDDSLKVRGDQLIVDADVINSHYDMGEGSIDCKTAGTPYSDEAYHQNNMSDCSYVYNHSGQYKVNTRFDWLVTWYTIKGDHDAFGFYATGNINLNIQQEESVNR